MHTGMQGTSWPGTNPGTDHTSGRHWRITTPAPIPGSRETATLDPVTVHHGGAWH
ncbi:hypothetical protein PBI_ISOLDE_94 [Arthrobacter phage Isolde]|uniref:Uncharacterized protein n=1 Tax=Arthrobacter phage Isolde TaxID=2419610 RepID=A0A3G3M3Q6_9CAUD|nr:hypothetical protein PP638_gp10 [Arthrobacter phage Isolde]AYR01061.1 hypothetical protein PBI_ISOLDE_94 [Arthrobacter phage Isolde]